MTTDTGNREERIASLEQELDELRNSAVEDVSTALNDAEEVVTEVAEQSREDVVEAHDTISQAANEVEDAVEEQAEEVAEEIGHPEQAREIAEHLYNILHEKGALPHTAGEHSDPAAAAPVPVAETEVHGAVEAVEPAADTPPDPVHWWYRPIKFRR